MKSERDEAIEDYIEDWYWDWDAESHKLAYQTADFLFEFMDDLEENSGLAENTKRKHFDNCWIIGSLICRVGDYSKFSLDIFSHPPFQLYEFTEKFWNTEYQVRSYISTCNKLKKYAQKKMDLASKK